MVSNVCAMFRFVLWMICLIAWMVTHLFVMFCFACWNQLDESFCNMDDLFNCSDGNTFACDVLFCMLGSVG